MDRRTVRESANIIGGRFVLVTKNFETDNHVHKALFVVQGHTDSGKDLLVHSTNTIRQHSVRLLVAIAAISQFMLWTQDVYQAYLQAGDGLKRNVYIGAPQ